MTIPHIRKDWKSQAWWFMIVISALERLRQEDLKFKASLGYRLSQKQERKEGREKRKKGRMEEGRREGRKDGRDGGRGKKEDKARREREVKERKEEVYRELKCKKEVKEKKRGAEDRDIEKDNRRRGEKVPRTMRTAS
jgi:hypothetical protein